MPSEINFYTGFVGSGKTLHAMFDAIRIAKRRHAIILGNLHIHLKEAVYVSPEDIIMSILDVHNENTNPTIELLNNNTPKVFILDEIDKWFHSREHMKPFNIWLSSFITQIRKRNMDMVFTATRPSALDLAGRSEVSEWIRCQGIYYPKPYDRIPYKFIYSRYNERSRQRKIYSMKAKHTKWLWELYNTEEKIIPISLIIQMKKVMQK